jgi:Protein of unknown function (DUF2281)
MSHNLQAAEQMLQKLQPQQINQVIDYIDFLLRKQTPRRKMSFDWEGGLVDEKVTSVELQHLANKWRSDEAVD